MEKKMMRVMPREDSSVFNITRSEGAQKQSLEKSFHSMQYRTKIPDNSNTTIIMFQNRKAKKSDKGTQERTAHPFGHLCVGWEVFIRTL